MAEGMARRFPDHPGVAGAEGLFTPAQDQEVARHLASLQVCPTWHGGLPVLLLERCWLRLSWVAVEDLARRLPPDASREAPELERYRQLLGCGHPPWQAQQLCWEEFGAQACREALLRYWDSRDSGRQDWTLQHYLELVGEYRRRFEAGRPRALPLLVLARAGEPRHGDSQRLVWLKPQGSEPSHPMRHTCA